MPPSLRRLFNAQTRRLVALITVARSILSQRPAPSEVNEQLEVPVPVAKLPDAPDDKTRNLRHDLHTPIKLIMGFCEALLSSASPQNPPVPAPYRADIEAILRNARQLDDLITNVFRDPDLLPATDAHHPATSPRRTVVLLDEGGAAFEMLSLYASHLSVIRMTSVDELGRLGDEIEPAAIIVTGDDDTVIPLIAQVVGRHVPILTLSLTSGRRSLLPDTLRYLNKPIQFDALESALMATGTPIHEALIVDDNRDSLDLLSRMIVSLPQPPRLLKAYSGREALAILKERIPDVIFLDFVLPDVDGMVILDYLRADSRLSQIPILLMSAHQPLDIEPVSRASKLTLIHLAGVSPVRLAHDIERLLTDITGDSG